MLVSSSAWKTFKRIYVRTYVQEILASLHHFYDCVTSISWYSFPGYITINNSNNMKYFCFFFQRRRQQRTEKERSKRRRQYWFHDSSQIFLKAELFFILFTFLLIEMYAYLFMDSDESWILFFQTTFSTAIGGFFWSLTPVWILFFLYH